MSDAELQRLAVTLLHFVWEGAAIALLAWALMTLFSAARVRYAIGCLGLVAMSAAPLVTYTMLTPPPAPIVAPADTSPQTMSLGEVVPTRAIEAPAPRLSLAERVRIDLTLASPWIAGLWIAGVALVGLRHAVGIVVIVRLRRRASDLVHPELRARLARVARRMHVTRHVTLLASAAIDGPCVLGWLRPAILWPACAMTGLTPLQLDALLAHELAHVRRHDYLVNLLQACVETFGFYHPAVWWLSRRVRQEREHCCDDIAAKVVGDRVGYAEALAAFESLRAEPTFSLAAHGGSLMQRIRRLLAVPTPRHAPLGRIGGPMLVAVLLIAGVQILRAGPEAAAPSPTSVVLAEDPADAADDAQPPATRPAASTQSVERDLAGKAMVDAERRVREQEQKFREMEQRFREMEAARRQPPPHGPMQLDNEELARREPFFARLLEERDRIALDLAQLQQLQGPDSPPVAKVRLNLDTMNQRVKALAEQLARRNVEYLEGNYYIAGIVARPGVFELNGHRISVVQAIIAAGYNMDQAAGVRIVRRWPDPAKETTLYVVANVVTGTGNDVTLRPDDTIFVGRPAAPGDPATMPTTAPVP